MLPNSPIDHRDGLSVRSVSIGQQGIVDAHELEAFDDCQRSTGQDGLNGAFWRDVRIGGSGSRGGGKGGGGSGGSEGLGFDETDARD